MSFYITTAHSTRITARVSRQTGLVFDDEHLQSVHIPNLPAGVAEATADAFNAAMEAAKETAE